VKFFLFLTMNFVLIQIIFMKEKKMVKFTLPFEVSGVFQFELQCLKIGNIPPNVSKIFNSDFPLLISVKFDKNL
jgi:hypothetical protein